MSAASDLLGGASAVEVLCGKLLSQRDVQEGVIDLLALDHFARFQAVLQAAECWQAGELPHGGTSHKQPSPREEVAALGSVPWIHRSQLESKVHRDVIQSWLSRNAIFSILSAIALDLFPSYAISADGSPSPEIPEILRWLEYPSGIATAVWFESTSSFLRGARPRELIMSDPGLVVSAAKYEFRSKHAV